MIALLFVNIGKEAHAEETIEPTFSISENSQQGALVVQLPAKDPVNGESLTYDLLPSFPDELSPILWLDASKLDRAETTWVDKSNFGNHAKMHGTAKGYPYVRRNAHNGLSLMHYCGADGAYHSFDEISNLRTAFWVVAKKEEAWSSLLGHHSQYPFHFADNNTLLHDFYASSFVKGGSIRISGNEGNASSFFPSSLSLISIRTSGNITVSNFSHVLEYNGRYFNGDLGELILFDAPLTDAQISEVETYLSGKWALPLGYDPLPQPFVLSPSGELRSTRTFDHEKLAVRKVRIRTTAASGESVDRTYRILVTDVVEDLDGDGVQDPFDEDIDGDSVSNVDELAYGTNPLDPNSLNRAPTNLRALAELSVRENLPAGTAVGRVIADDADGDILSYTLQSSDFAIDEEGNLTTLRPLDHEATSSIPVSISATDPRGGVVSSQFQVQVIDDTNDLDEDGVANESDSDRDGDGMSNELELANGSDPDDFSSLNHAPVDLNLTGNRQIEENMPAGTIVGRVVANDEDGNDTLAYSLVTGDGDTYNSLFELNSTTGELRTAQFFDYETDGASLSVRVQAKDDHNISTEHAYTIDLIDSDLFSPISLDANLMLWLDAMDGNTLDRGDFLGDLGTPEDGNETRFWADKSGHHHHAVRISGSPVYESAGLHGLPSIDTSGDRFELLDSNASFDAWNRMTVFVTFKWTGTWAWAPVIFKNSTWGETTFLVVRMNPVQLSQGTGTFYGLGGSYKRTNGGNVTDARDHPVALSLVYDGSAGTNRIFGNGALGQSSTDNPSQLRSNPDIPVQLGSNHLISEILIFNDAMSDENREKVEGYLGQKWGLLDHFPLSHPYRNRGVTDDPLMILEGSAGRPVAHLSELDTDFNASWTYSLTDANESNDNELFSVFDPATFDPASLNNLALWLDAADTSTITADSDGNVSVWADKSGNQNNATQLNASQQPIQISNSIKFDGTDDSLSLEHGVLPDSTEPSMVFLVAKCDASSGSDGFLSNGRNGHHGQSFAYRTNGIGSVYFYSWSNDLNAQVEGNNTILKVHVLELSLEDTSVKIFQDGILRGTKTSFVGTQNLGNENGLIGNASGGFLDGKINEIILIKNEPSDEIRLKTEGYLANKWGIVDQLPAVHPGRKDVLLTATSLDYETNASAYQVRVQATANGAVQNQKDYRILLGDIYEDLDGDWIADHLDLDDDGDGFSDVEELAYPSDPRDPLSLANSPPHEINASGDLTVSETAEAGTVIGQFTATDPDGDANLTFSITSSVNQLEPVLWLDASHPSAETEAWEDQSSEQNHAYRFNTPTVIPNELNGLPIMRYETNSTTPDYHEWNRITTIRTVFSVVKRNSGGVLADSNSVHFWLGGGSKLLDNNTAQAIREGTISLNGSIVDGWQTNFPQSQFSIVCIQTESAYDGHSANVYANRIGKDRARTEASFHFDGDYAELIIFNKVLTDVEIQSTEYYLAQKWGLMSNLHEAHPLKNYTASLAADSLSMEENGTLKVADSFDYESDQNHTVLVTATDLHGASFSKAFTFTVTDQFEDLDGDGTADHLDPDIDGDELSNEDEMTYGSDPYDSNSSNQPPASLLSQNSLSMAENSPAGSVVGTILATDPDGNETVSLEIIDNFSLGDLHPAMPLPEVWFDANHSQSIVFEEGNLTAWMDRSGNARHATLETGTPEYNATAGPSGSPVVQFRKDGGQDKFTIEGKFLLRDHYYVVRSPSEYWDGWGGVIGHNDGRGSNYLLEPWGEFFHWDQYPAEVWRDGVSKSIPFRLIPLSEFMILRVVVNASHLIERDSWRLGHTNGGTATSMDLSEAIAFSARLPNEEAAEVEAYLANKWGIKHHSAHGSFTLENGVLRTNRTYNYETDERNMTITVRATDDHGAYIDQNFSILLTNQLEDEDEDGVEDYTGTERTVMSELSVAQSLSIAENEPAGTIVGRVEAVDADGDRFHNYDIKFRPKADAFHPSLIEGITAWFDATDDTTLQNFEGTNKLKRWTNKVDREVMLAPREESNAPTSNGSLNGLNAIGFDSLYQIPKQLFASKQGANWNPMGENGAASGKLYDGSLYMVYRSDKSANSNFPFNFGWGDHFPYGNKWIYWDFSDRRRDTFLAENGDELMVGFEFSVTRGNQVFYKNGEPLLTGPRTAPSNIGGSFFFPHGHGGTQIPEWTVGEMVVIRGVVQRDDHQRIEGYLAHKWGLADQLPSTHAYSPGGATFGNADDFFRIDENGTIRTKAPLDHEFDRNFTLTVRARDDFFAYSSERNFTVLITDVEEADLDGDGIEDVLDEDWDGDGISNEIEWKNNSDPMDLSSSNRMHTDILASALSFRENTAIGSNVITFSVDDPDVDQSHTYRLLGNGKIGWRTFPLKSDHDSGIKSNRIYTCAVNINGEDQVVNGVTFVGEPGKSGIGWEITQGFDNLNVGKRSNVDGDIGKMLSQGFRWAGRNQKFKLTGLTAGKTYVFSLYSQAWNVGHRNVTISNSALDGSISVNQNAYFQMENNGILVECTYVANSSNCEINIVCENSDNTWHLYAFSNHEALPFDLNENGTLSLSKVFDYETDSHSYPVEIIATDDYNLSLQKEFTLSLANEIEDLDGDEIENHLDDDIDGDRVSNLDEERYRTNPRDSQSVNLPPSAIISSSELSLLENQPAGAVVTQFSAEDAQGSDTVKLSMLPLYPDWIEPTVWLDANDPGTLERASDGSVARWRNRVPGGRDFVQADAQAQPSIGSVHLNHYPVLEFDGSDYLHSEGDLRLGANFSIFMVAGIRQANQSDALLSYTSGCEGPDFHFIANGTNEFYGRFSNVGMGRSRNFFQEPENGPALYELIFDHDSKIMRVLVNGLNAGITDYENPPGEHHILRLFANKHVDGFIGGTLGEVLVYPKAIGGNARKNVEVYLGNKWGLEMSEPVPPYGFAMRADGTLITTKSFDYETDQNHTITVRAMDDGNLTLDLEFTVYLQNVVEDADGDGTEDHYDPDDDNDGIEDTLDPDDDNDHASDLAERYLGTNERNASSRPNFVENGFDLNRSEFPENLPVGESVGKFYSFGQLGNISLRYFLVEGDGARDNQKFSIDSNGSLRPKQSFDYERVEPEFSVRVRADDQAGFYLERRFTITLSNVFEDIDGDGTEDFYDDDIDGDGFSNEIELGEGTNPRDPFSVSLQPILKTISGYWDRNGSINLRGRVEANGDGKVTDFGFVLSSKSVMSRSAGKDIWIRGEGNASNFTLKVDENPFDGDLYFRAWAKNVAGYGVGSVKKVVFEMEPSGWWGQTEEFDGGWMKSSWFGTFRNYEDGWLYHARLGWLYSKEAPEQSVWLWQESRGWLWTQAEIWPYLWSNRSSDWIYFFPSKAGEPVYLFDQATGTAEPFK